MEEKKFMSKKKMTRFDLQKMKQENQKAVWITAYDYWTASFAEEAGMDMILVGDSLGMCIYGYSGTVPVTMDQCIWHSEAVRRGAAEHLYYRRHALFVLSGQRPGGSPQRRPVPQGSRRRCH
jgi:hypothetical protein